MKAMLIGLALCGLMLAACGGDDAKPVAAVVSGAPKETAFDALRRQLRYLGDGQAGRAWQEIHPAQQALIPQALYVQCVSAAGSFDVSNIKIKESFGESMRIPGTTIDAQSTALTVSYTIKRGLLELEDTDTFHEIAVDGQWRFTVKAASAYAAGRCD